MGRFNTGSALQQRVLLCRLTSFRRSPVAICCGSPAPASEHLRSAACWLGSRRRRHARARSLNPLAPLPTHHPARAKRCIFVYLPGGPSQIDLFDPKTRLQTENGRPLPFEKPKLQRTATGGLFASPWKFARHGESGMEISELLPCLARHADDLCVIRSMVADNINHTGAALQMNTGDERFPRPSLGAWLTYGLGSENENLPGFVVISPKSVFQGSPLWGASFLPASYQATWVRDLNNPIDYLKDPEHDRHRLRRQLDTLAR